jgi:methylated-DNA-[protein]-cysteine S-methyltransferase
VDELAPANMNSKMQPGKDMAIRHRRIATPFGDMTLFSDDGDRLIALALPSREESSRRWLKRHYASDATSEGEIAAAEPLNEYFAGNLEAIRMVKWKAVGTPFQLKVWNSLYRIPIGATTTYGAIAAQLGTPNAMRAVGAANGANPIAVVVPCHRVIGSDGSLTGFGGGLPLKIQLLRHEGVPLGDYDTPNLFD